jgi:hypothetical protein
MISLFYIYKLSLHIKMGYFTTAEKNRRDNVHYITIKWELTLEVLTSRWDNEYLTYTYPTSHIPDVLRITWGKHSLRSFLLYHERYFTVNVRLSWRIVISSGSPQVYLDSYDVMYTFPSETWNIKYLCPKKHEHCDVSFRWIVYALCQNVCWEIRTI